MRLVSFDHRGLILCLGSVATPCNWYLSSPCTSTVYTARLSSTEIFSLVTLANPPTRRANALWSRMISSRPCVAERSRWSGWGSVLCRMLCVFCVRACCVCACMRVVVVVVWGEGERSTSETRTRTSTLRVPASRLETLSCGSRAPARRLAPVKQARHRWDKPGTGGKRR